MDYWDMIHDAVQEMTMAAQLAQQECIGLIEKYRFSEAGKAAVSRDGYYECAMTALKML